MLNTALGSAPAFATVFPTTGIGSQLKQVAQLIAARNSLGLRRQIFFCSLGDPDDSGNEVRWIPTTAVDQYAATLASWYGLPSSGLTTVFPNTNRFASSNLGLLT